MKAIVYSDTGMRLGSPAQLPPDEPRLAVRPAPANAPAIDRTTLIVRLGLLVLALTGVITIFGDALFGVGVGQGVTNSSITPTPPMPAEGTSPARP
ncbi:MAG TPA: hypothetical protein VGG33_07445 [Polyangia bacterium]